MFVKNAIALIVLGTSDLKAESKQKETDTVTLKDMKDDVQTECSRTDVGVIIFEDESKVRKIVSYNNDLLDEGVSSPTEVLEESTVGAGEGAE